MQYQNKAYPMLTFKSFGHRSEFISIDYINDVSMGWYDFSDKWIENANGLIEFSQFYKMSS